MVYKLFPEVYENAYFKRIKLQNRSNFKNHSYISSEIFSLCITKTFSTEIAFELDIYKIFTKKLIGRYLSKRCGIKKRTTCYPNFCISFEYAEDRTLHGCKCNVHGHLFTLNGRTFNIRPINVLSVNN